MTFRVAYWPFPVQVMLLCYLTLHQCFFAPNSNNTDSSSMNGGLLIRMAFYPPKKTCWPCWPSGGVWVRWIRGSHALCSWGLAVSLQACFTVWFEVWRHASKYLQQYIYIYCSFNRKIPSFQHLSCCKSETQSSLPTQSLRDTAGNVACSSLQALCFTLPFNKTLWDPHICSCRSKLTWKRHVSSSFSASKKKSKFVGVSVGRWPATWLFSCRFNPCFWLPVFFRSSLEKDWLLVLC